MPTLHLYIRTQIMADAETVNAVADSARSLQATIRAAGGDAGSVSIIAGDEEPVPDPALGADQPVHHIEIVSADENQSVEEG